MNTIGIACVLLLCCFALATQSSENNEEMPAEDNSIEAFEQQYIKLFKSMRLRHNEAVKKLLSFEDYDRQKEMISMLVEKLNEILKKARKYVEPFESYNDLVHGAITDEKTRTELSLVLENTAFVADLALHFPDFFNKFYENDRKLQDNVKWAFKYSNNTNLYDETTRSVINLAAQELDILPKDPNYINPYKSYWKKKYQSQDKKKESNKKEKKKRKRGPGLSNEL